MKAHVGHLTSIYKMLEAMGELRQFKSYFTKEEIGHFRATHKQHRPDLTTFWHGSDEGRVHKAALALVIS